MSRPSAACVAAAAHRRALAWCCRVGWGEVIDDELEGVESLFAVVVGECRSPLNLVDLVEVVDVSGWDTALDELRIDCVRGV